MPMDPSRLKSKLEQRIYNGFKAEFSASASKGTAYTSVADEQWLKMAKAISGIAADIILEITQNAMVQPGVPTAGGPSSQATVAPGKIS